MDCSNAELSILFTDDHEIQKLNAQYRSKNKPTDVLSFPLEPVGRGAAKRVLGDVVISCETAQRQAREYREPLRDELLRLLIHGLLHLLGYDHEGVSLAKAQQMRRMEHKLRVLIRKEFTET